VDPDDLISNQGMVLSAIFPMLFSAANRFGVDYAITSTEMGAYSVMQVLRQSYCPWSSGPFTPMSTKQRWHAKRLCRETMQDRIAVFFGAGVSIPSGLPTWQGLLDKMQQQLVDTGVISSFDKQDMQELGVLDQATILEMTMGAHKMKCMVRDITSKGLFTPCHSLLGALRVAAITTNYDDLYESSHVGNVMRLPWDAPLLGAVHHDIRGNSTRKILKLHGCVTRPDSIVLTRQDYLRYGDEREALRGLVSRSLLEKELLICGFSMTDDNMHLVIDRVRKVWNDRLDHPKHEEVPSNVSAGASAGAGADTGAWDAPAPAAAQDAGSQQGLEGRSSSSRGSGIYRDQSGRLGERALSIPNPSKKEEKRKMGTILTLVANKMFTKLWSEDFHVVACCAEDDDDAESEGVPVTPQGASCYQYGAWVHDIFLDYMNHLLEVDRAHDSFILDSRYATMLDKHQHQLRAALKPLVALYEDEEMRKSNTWPTIVEMLERVGQQFDYSNPEPKPVDDASSPAMHKRIASIAGNVKEAGANRMHGANAVSGSANWVPSDGQHSASGEDAFFPGLHELPAHPPSAAAEAAGPAAAAEAAGPAAALAWAATAALGGREAMAMAPVSAP